MIFYPSSFVKPAILAITVLLFHSLPVSGHGSVVDTGNKEGDCSSYQHSKELADGVVLKFVSTNTTISVEMSSDKQGYLGFGVSPNGLMIGSNAVIGAQNDVSMYALNQKIGSMIQKLEADEQTLTDTSFVQNDQGSVLKFTKLLDDGYDYPLDSNGTNTVIWAVGISNAFNTHVQYGILSLDLSPCGGDISVLDKDYKSHFVAHGILASIAFGAFIPLALMSALGRYQFSFDFQKSQLWFIIHTTLNVLSYILTVIVFSLAVNVFEKQGNQHFKAAHHTIGLVVFILMTLQIFIGVFRPSKPSTTDEEKSKVRLVWEWVHKPLGAAILVLGWYQIYTGFELLEVHYGISFKKGVFWAFAGIVAFMIAGFAVLQSTHTDENVKSEIQID